MSNFIYKNMTPFKWFVLENFPFIENNFEAINNYRLFSKVVEYLNEMKDNVNNFGQLIEEFSNYFDNLDVQEEINNKLDEMAENGSLSLLLQPFFNNVNSDLIELNQKINNVDENSLKNENGIITSDLLSQEVREMITGGSIPIVGDNSIISSNIVNGAIDILTLSDNIKDNFELIMTPKNLGTDYVGLATVSNNQVSINSNSSFKYNMINLEKGKIYDAIGFMENSTAYSLIVADNNRNVKFASTHTTGAVPNYTMFRVVEDNLIAYVSYIVQDTNSGTQIKALRELTNIINIKNYSNVINKIKDIENMFVNYSNTSYGSPRLLVLNDYNIHVYEMVKNKKYNIKAYNISNSSGIVITNMKNIVTYNSGVQSSVLTPLNYTFTAQENGFIYITQIPNYDYSINIVDESKNYKIANKKISFVGDSICHGVGSSNGYPSLINNISGANCINLGESGATIVSNTYQEENPRGWINEIVENISNDTDIIVFEGGFNDYGLSVELGSLTNNFTDEVDNAKFYGALEKMFRYCNENYNVPMFYVITHNINGYIARTNNQNLTLEDYYEAIRKTCEKYSVKVIDITKNSSFNTFYNNRKALCNNNDGIHPTNDGYLKYYIPLIINTLENSLNIS